MNSLMQNVLKLEIFSIKPKGCLQVANFTYRIYLYKCPGVGGGATITDKKKNQLSSHFPTCIMVRELKILETNLKFLGEIIKFYLVFLQISLHL